MKWYKYWKIYIIVGIFFGISILFNLSSIRLHLLPNIILFIGFICLGLNGKKKFQNDDELQVELRHAAWEKLPPEEKYKGLKKIETNIVGVTYNNDDGSSRQELLKTLKNNEQLHLQEYVFNGKPAYYVLNSNNKCLGNLSQDIANNLKKKYDTNEKLVFVKDCRSFDKNKYDDDYYNEDGYNYDDEHDDDYYDNDNDTNKEPNIIYCCEIVIFIK